MLSSFSLILLPFYFTITTGIIPFTYTCLVL